MTNYDFLEQYVTKHNGKHVNRQNYYIDGTLTTYSTDICFLDAVKLVAKVNNRKYSTTTSKLVSQLVNILTRHGYKIEYFNGESCTYWNYGYCSDDNKWTTKELKQRGIF